MIDLVLVNKDMLYYVQYVRAVRGIGTRPLRSPFLLCKVRLIGTWIKRREVVDGVRSIRSEKLKEHQYIQGYAKSL